MESTSLRKMVYPVGDHPRLLQPSNNYTTMRQLAKPNDPSIIKSSPHPMESQKFPSSQQKLI
eukprot:14253293-Ditylum_brightwellii.AAC.1